MELSSPKITKISYIFSKKSFSYISGNRHFQEGTFQAQKMKKFPIFREMELSSTKKLNKTYYTLNKTPLREKLDA